MSANPLTFPALARDLRREAAYADRGKALDPDDEGSVHAQRLRSDHAYRTRYTQALTETAHLADLAAARGQGNEDEPDRAPGRQAWVQHVVDPLDPSRRVAVEVALDESPLELAWAFGEITDLQRLAGVMYEADCSGLTGYVSNTAAIQQNGQNLIKGAMEARSPTEASTGFVELNFNPTEGTQGRAWRVAQVDNRWLGKHARLAKAHLLRKLPVRDLAAFKDMLDRLVLAYAVEDRYFEAQATRIPRPEDNPTPPPQSSHK